MEKQLPKKISIKNFQSIESKTLLLFAWVPFEETLFFRRMASIFFNAIRDFRAIYNCY